jgi:hypothetical protein
VTRFFLQVPIVGHLHTAPVIVSSYGRGWLIIIQTVMQLEHRRNPRRCQKESYEHAENDKKFHIFSVSERLGTRGFGGKRRKNEPEENPRRGKKKNNNNAETIRDADT